MLHVMCVQTHGSIPAHAACSSPVVKSKNSSGHTLKCCCGVAYEIGTYDHTVSSYTNTSSVCYKCSTCSYSVSHNSSGGKCGNAHCEYATKNRCSRGCSHAKWADPACKDHSYSSSWTQTSTEHYKKCTVTSSCSSKKDEGDHVDSNTDGKCDTCGYSMAIVVTVPTGTNYTYDGTTKTGVPTGTGYTLSGTASATNAGSYSATATLSSGYIWSDGTSTAKTISWSISRKSISVPTGTNHTYDGTAKTGVSTGTGYTLSGTTSATNAGAYTATATPTSNYQWSDGTTGAKDISWSISRKSISVPTGTNHTYDGSLKTGLSSTTTYTAGGTNTATNAGSYTATAIPTSNYQWSDGTTGAKDVSWSISRATISVPTGTDYVYNGSLRTGVAAGTGYSRGGTYQATNVGSYTATVTPTSNYMWNDGTTSAKSISWSITRKSISKPTATNRTYNGTQQVGVPTGTGYTLTGTPKATNAGTYNVTVTLNSNYKWSDGTTSNLSLSWTMNKATMGGSIKIDGTNTYGETLTANTDNVTPTGCSFTYQWWYATSSTATSGTNISGATSKTFTIDDALYVGKYMGVTVNATKANYISKTYTDITDSTNNGTATVDKATGYVNLSATSEKVVYLTESKTFTITSYHGGTLGIEERTSTDAEENLNGTTVTIENLSGMMPDTQVTIRVTSAETDTHYSAYADYTLTIDRRVATIVPSVNDITITGGNSTTFTYTYDGDGNITVASSDTSVVTASVDTTTKTVTIVGAEEGNATITISGSQGATYKATSATVSIVVRSGNYLVEGIYYTTLKEAYDGVSGTTGTIKVVRDNTDDTSVTIANTKTITLDLFGKTLTKTVSGLTNNGTLIITDTSSTKAGTVTGEVDILITNYGTVTVNDGTLIAEGDDPTEDTCWAVISAIGSGNVNINGGTLKVTRSASTTELGARVIDIDNGTLNITGGTILGEGTGGVAVHSYDGVAGTINISGGTIKAGHQAVNCTGVNQNGTKVTVTGGYIEGEYSGIGHNSTGALVVKGGTIIANTNNAIRNVAGAECIIGDSSNKVTISTPTIQGYVSGVYSPSGFYFYDGTIKGVDEIYSGEILGIQDHYVLYYDTETINSDTYNTMYLIPYIMERENLDSDVTEFIIGANRAGMTQYTSDLVETITLQNNLNIPTGAVNWDASYANDGSIMVWITDSDSDGLYELYIGAEGGMALNNGCRLFSNYEKCTQITNLKYLITSHATNMHAMFNECYELTSLDISSFDTSKITDMSYIFSTCTKLTSINLTGINTSQVTDMNNMFNHNEKLATINLTGFDTSKVTNMESMFDNCSSLTNLNVSNFVTTNVTNMKGMFGDCKGLTSLDITNFDTTKNTTMYRMFEGCSGLSSINLSNFVTSNVTDMGSMFEGCSGLDKLDITNFNTAKVTSMDKMFKGCSNISRLDLSNLNTLKVTNMEEMFMNSSSLKSVLLGNNVDKLSGTDMFTGCSSLTAIITQKSITASDSAITLGTTTGLNSLTNSILYVPNLDSETYYEDATNYSTVFGDARIQPILELIGESTIGVVKKENYTEEGATVAGFVESNSSEYTEYGYSLVGPTITKDGTIVQSVDTSIDATYLIKYTLEYKGSTVMIVIRTVKIVRLQSSLTVSKSEIDVVVGNTEQITYEYVGDGTVNFTIDNKFATINPTATSVDITGVYSGETVLKIVAMGDVYEDIAMDIVVRVLKANYSITSGNPTSGETTIYYNTLQDAVNDAIDGDTINVLDDVTEEGRISINKDVVLVLDNYKISLDTPIRIERETNVNIIGDVSGEIENLTGTAIENEGHLKIGIDDVVDENKGPIIKGEKYGIDSSNGEFDFECGVLVGERNPPYKGTPNTVKGSYIFIEKIDGLYYASIKNDETPPTISNEVVEDRVIGRGNIVKITIYVKDDESGIDLDSFTEDDFSYNVEGEDVRPGYSDLVYVGKNAQGAETYILSFNGIDENGKLTVSIADEKVFNNAKIGNLSTILTQDAITIDCTAPDLTNSIFELIKPKDGYTNDGEYEAKLSNVVDPEGIAEYQWELKRKDESDWEVLSTINTSEDYSFYAGTLKDEGTYDIRVKVSDVNGNQAYTKTLEIIYEKYNPYDGKPTISFEKEAVINGTDVVAVDIHAIVKSTTNIVSAKVDGVEIPIDESVVEGEYQIRTHLYHTVGKNAVYKFEVQDEQGNVTSRLYNVSDIGSDSANITYMVINATAYENGKIIFNSDKEVRLKDTLPEGFIVSQPDIYTQYRKEIIIYVIKDTSTLNDSFTFVDRIGNQTLVHVSQDIEATNRNIRTVKNIEDESKLTNVYSGEITITRAENLVGSMKIAKSIDEGKVRSYYGIDSAKVDIKVSSLTDFSAVTTLGAASVVQAKDENGDVVNLEQSSTIIDDSVRGISESTNDNLTGIYQRESALVSISGDSVGNSFHVTIINR